MLSDDLQREQAIALARRGLELLPDNAGLKASVAQGLVLAGQSPEAQTLFAEIAQGAQWEPSSCWDPLASSPSRADPDEGRHASRGAVTAVGKEPIGLSISTVLAAINGPHAQRTEAQTRRPVEVQVPVPGP